MKLLKYSLTSLMALGLLTSVVSSSYAEDACSFPSYDPLTGNIQLPCVQAYQQLFSASLDLVAPKVVGATVGGFWSLGDFGTTRCQASINQCATVDDNLNLLIPIEGVIKGVKHVAVLKYYPTSQPFGIYWQYDEIRPINEESTVVLKSSTPNSNGGFEKLFTLEGNFANDFNKVRDLMALADGVTVPQPQLKAGDEITLRIFHFNDLHNELRSVSQTRGDTHRFSQMVKIIKEARAKQAANEIILVVSAGDDHIGNPFDELMGYDANSFQVDSAYHAYSAAGIDAAVIGNHELDRGTALLAKAIEQNAKFPILSANLYGSQHLTANHYHPAIIGVAKGLRIGIIGLTTKEETLLKQKDDPQFAAGELLTTLENTLPYVEPLADVIILLTHVGYNGDDSTQVRHELDVGDVQIAEAAAKMTAKPIVVIGGHLHLSINTAGLNVVDKSVPILEAGAKGSHLGEAVFSLLKTKNGGLRSQITARLIPLKRRDDRVKPEDSTYNTYEHDADLDLEFEKTVMAPLYKQLDTKLQEVIGTAGNSTDIATATTIADRYVGESAIANFMNDAIVARSATFPEKEGKSQQVQLAVFNASGISSGVEPSATIDFNDWYSVMPFADMIVIAQMTGAQIKEMVISNAQRLVRPEELTSDKPLDLTGYISRGFLHFSSSLQYTIKLNASATTATVQDVVFNGKPLDEQLLQTFNVAFSDYVVLRGGEGWNGTKIGAGLPEDIIGINLMTLPKNDTGLVYRNEIIAYLKEHQVVDETTGAVKDGRLKVIP